MRGPEHNHKEDDTRAQDDPFGTNEVGSLELYVSQNAMGGDFRIFEKANTKGDSHVL